MTNTITTTPAISVSNANVTTPRSFTLLPDSDITKMITKVGASGNAFNELTHATACQCLAHAEKHGNFTLLTKLMEALPKAARKNALKAWVLAFSPSRWVTEGALFKKSKAVSAAPFNLQGAIAKPYYDYTVEPEVRMVTEESVTKAIEGALRNARKKVEAGEFTGSSDNLLNLISAYETSIAPVAVDGLAAAA